MRSVQVSFPLSQGGNVHNDAMTRVRLSAKRQTDTGVQDAGANGEGCNIKVLILRFLSWTMLLNCSLNSGILNRSRIPLKANVSFLFVLEILPSTMKPHRPGTESPMDGRMEYFTTGQKVRCVAAPAGQSAMTGGYSVNQSHKWRSDAKVI